MKDLAESDPAFNWEGDDKFFYVRDECEGAVKQIQQRTGGWCLIERSGVSPGTLSTFRALRDGVLGTRFGRVLTTVYYRTNS
jgi:hypothetical protein